MITVVALNDLRDLFRSADSQQRTRQSVAAIRFCYNAQEALHAQINVLQGFCRICDPLHSLVSNVEVERNRLGRCLLAK